MLFVSRNRGVLLNVGLRTLRVVLVYANPHHVYSCVSRKSAYLEEGHASESNYRIVPVITNCEGIALGSVITGR